MTVKDVMDRVSTLYNERDVHAVPYTFLGYVEAE